jgi:hypothetical protein
MYCPVNILLERVVKRNKTAIENDPNDRRSLMRPLETFINIYTSTESLSFVDEIQRDFLIKIFNTAHSRSQKENDDHPMSKLPWQDIFNILDSNFGSDPNIKLQSKHPYFMLLDTSKKTPGELAINILNYIKKPFDKNRKSTPMLKTETTKSTI